MALLRELLRLDWKKRINAIDALEHPYLHSAPYPAKPGDLPVMEESHEYDRRKFHDRKAALPPAPKGGTVGRGPQQGAAGADAGFNNGDGFGGRNGGMNGGRYPPPSHRNGPGPGERVPAWGRGPHGLPPRPPPPADNYGNGEPRDRTRPPRDRGPVGGVGGAGSAGSRSDIDTYIPSYQRERVDRYERDRRRDRRTRSRSPVAGREWDHRDRR